MLLFFMLHIIFEQWLTIGHLHLMKVGDWNGMWILSVVQMNVLMYRFLSQYDFDFSVTSTGNSAEKMISPYFSIGSVHLRKNGKCTKLYISKVSIIDLIYCISCHIAAFCFTLLAKRPWKWMKTRPYGSIINVHMRKGCRITKETFW